MVSLPIDADLVAYFQRDTEPPDWRGRINDLLRFFVESNEAIDAEREAARQAEVAQPEPSL